MSAVRFRPWPHPTLCNFKQLHFPPASRKCVFTVYFAITLLETKSSWVRHRVLIAFFCDRWAVRRLTSERDACVSVFHFVCVRIDASINPVLRQYISICRGKRRCFDRCFKCIFWSRNLREMPGFLATAALALDAAD